MMTKRSRSDRSTPAKPRAKRTPINDAFAALIVAGSVIGPAHALPLGGSVTGSSGGTVDITSTTDTLTVDSTANRVIIDWFGFSIAPTETVTFNQPGTSSIIVNRLGFNSGPFTSIEGILNSNGNVWIIDPRGIYFSPTSMVDVFGLLATPANLSVDDDFLNGAVGSPISFTMPSFPREVIVDEGATIKSRGGPLMFVGGIDSFGSNGGVFIDGVVTGADAANTPEQVSASQILYGLAGNFTLTFGQPNAMTSDDIRLFDFIIDTPAPRSYDTNTGGNALEVIGLGPTSNSIAGTVLIAGVADVPDPQRFGLNTLEFVINGPVESLSRNLVIGGAGVESAAFSTPTGIDTDLFASSADPAQIDVRFDRVANYQGGGVPPSLEQLVTVRSAGGTEIVGRNVTALQRFEVDDGEGGFETVPDHTTVEFTQTGTATNQLSISANGDIVLQNAQFIPNDTTGTTPSAAPGITAAGNLTIENSLGDINLEPGQSEAGFFSPRVNAGGAIVIREVAAPNGVLPSTPINIKATTVGQFPGLGLTSPTSVSVSTRGRVGITGIEATGNITVRGDGGVSGAYMVSSVGNILVSSANGDVSMGNASAFAPFSTGPVTFGTAGNVTISAAGLVDTLGDIIADSVQLTSTAGSVLLGADFSGVSFPGNVTAPNGISISASNGVVFADNLSAVNANVSVAAGTNVVVGDVAARNFSPITSTAGSITTGDATITNGAFTLNAPTSITTGDVVAAQQVSLTANNGAVTTGALDGVQVNVTSANNNVTITGPIDSINTTTINAAQGAVTTAAITSGNDLTITARDAVNTGALTTLDMGVTPPVDGSIRVESVSGAVTTGALRSDGVLSVLAGAGATTGDISAVQGVAILASGAVNTGAVSQSGFVEVNSTASTVTMGDIVSDFSIIVGGSGNVSVGNLTPGGGGAIGLDSANGSVTLGKATGTDLTVNAAGAIIAGAVAMTQTLTLDSFGGPVTAGALTSSNNRVLVEAGGQITTAAIDAGTFATLTTTAGGVATSGVQARNGVVTISAPGAVGAGAVTATNAINLTSTASALTAGAVIAGGALNAVGQTGVSVASASGSFVTLDSAAGATNVGVSGSPGAVTSTLGDTVVRGRDGVTTGVITAGSGSIIGRVTLDAANGAINTGDVTAAQSITGTAGGAVATGNLRAGTFVDVAAGGTLNTLNVTATGERARLVGAGNVAVGNVTAGREVDVQSTGGQAATGNLTAGLSVNAQAQNRMQTGNVDAGTSITIGSAANSVTIGNQLARNGAATLTAGLEVATGNVTATGAVTATSTSSQVIGGIYDAGGALTLAGPTRVSVQRATGASVALNASAGVAQVGTPGTPAPVLARTGDASLIGRDGVTAGNVTATGGAVTTNASAGAVTVGALVAGAGINGRGETGFTATSANAGLGVDLASNAGGLTIGTLTAQNGSVSVTGATALTTGAIAATSAVTATATAGDVTLAGATGQRLRVTAQSNTPSAGNVRLTGPVNISGGPAPTTPAVQIEASGNINVEAPLTSQFDAFFSAGGIFTNTAPIRVNQSVGVITTAAPQPTFGGLDIRARDVAIGDLLFARGARGVSIGVAGNAGAFLGDGAAPAGALNISGAELGRIDAPSFALRAGLGPNGGGPLTVGDASIDRARIGRLVLATGSGGTLRVVGTVNGVGAPELTLGDGAVLPGDIEIVGSLGTSGQPFGQTAIISGGDILIGTQAFVDLVNAAPNKTTFNVNALDPGLGGATEGQLFFVAGSAVFSAPGVILQQNTGRNGNAAGVRFGVPAPNTFAGAFGAFTAPQRIELFGQVIGLNGATLSEDEAAKASNLLAPGLASNSNFRINGCVIGATGACQTETAFDPVQLNNAIPGPAAGSGQGQAGRGANAGPQGPRGPNARRAADLGSKFEVDPSDEELSATADTRDERDPGVGAANEDLWPAE